MLFPASDLERKLEHNKVHDDSGLKSWGQNQGAPKGWSSRQ